MNNIVFYLKFVEIIATMAMGNFSPANACKRWTSMLTQANRRKNDKSDTESASTCTPPAATTEPEPEPVAEELPLPSTRANTLPTITMLLRPIASSTQLPSAEEDSQDTQLPNDFNELPLVIDEVSDPDKTQELFVKPAPKKK